jgi:hypothetical protein
MDAPVVSEASSSTEEVWQIGGRGGGRGGERAASDLSLCYTSFACQQCRSSPRCHCHHCHHYHPHCGHCRCYHRRRQRCHDSTLSYDHLSCK